MRIITSLAAGLMVLAAPAIAQDSSSSSSAPTLESVQPAVPSEEIVDSELYSTSGQTEELDLAYDSEIGTEWQQIGEIVNIVLAQDGSMEGLIVEVGGFLEIADQHIFVAMQNLQMLDGSSNAEGVYFVTNLTRDEIEQMPAVGEGWFD